MLNAGTMVRLLFFLHIHVRTHAWFSAVWYKICFAVSHNGTKACIYETD
jgi:hypothetical protein